jgi:hypothetical protein
MPDRLALRTMPYLIMVGVIAILLWFVFKAPPRADSLGQQSDPAPTQSSTESDSPELATTGQPDSDGQNRSAVDAGVAPTDLAVNTCSLRLTIVEHGSDKPVPLARGFWVPYEGEVEQEVRARYSEGNSVDLEALTAVKGQAFTADRNGVVNLQVPKELVLIVARSGDLFGQKYVHAKEPSQQAELSLLTDYTLDVFVHDASGKALPDFPLALRGRHDNGSNLTFATRSNADGYARIHHLAVRMINNPNAANLELSAAGPFLDDTTISIDPHSWPTGTVDFAVGPFGSITLQLQNHDGSPHVESTRCALQLREPDPQFWRQVHGFRPRSQMGAVSIQALEGEVTFPYVGLGLELEAAAWMDASPRPYDLYLTGPVAQGEKVNAVIWMKTLRPTLSFRLVDLKGLPFRNLSLQCNFRLDAGSFNINAPAALHTDDDGWAEFIVPVNTESVPNAKGSLEILHQVGQTELRKMLELPQPLLAGVTDLGDVYLLVEPILAAGRVIDGQGNGVAKVALTLAISEGPGIGDPVRDEVFRSKPDGSFVIRGLTEATQIRLLASARGNQTQKLLFTPGAEDLLIQMNPPDSRLAGRILVDEGIAPNQLTVRAAPSTYLAEDAATADDSWNWPSARPETSGEFEIKLPATEAVTLLVFDSRSKVVLAELRQVMPAAPGQSSDPRLAEIDLRGQLHRFHLKFVDATGLAVQEVMLKLTDLPVMEDLGSSLASMMDGEGTFYLPVESFSFVAYGEGQRDLVGQARQPGDSTFRMQTGLPAVVRLLPPDALTGSHRAVLAFSTQPEGSGNLNLWNKPANAQGEIRFHFPAPGLYRPSLRIYRLDADGKLHHQNFPAPDQAPVFEVLDLTTEQSFDLLLDAEAITGFLAGE